MDTLESEIHNLDLSADALSTRSYHFVLVPINTEDSIVQSRDTENEKNAQNKEWTKLGTFHLIIFRGLIFLRYIILWYSPKGWFYLRIFMKPVHKVWLWKLCIWWKSDFVVKKFQLQEKLQKQLNEKVYNLTESLILKDNGLYLPVLQVSLYMLYDTLKMWDSWMIIRLPIHASKLKFLT